MGCGSEKINDCLRRGELIIGLSVNPGHAPGQAPFRAAAQDAGADGGGQVGGGVADEYCSSAYGRDLSQDEV